MLHQSAPPKPLLCLRGALRVCGRFPCCGGVHRVQTARKQQLQDQLQRGLPGQVGFPYAGLAAGYEILPLYLLCRGLHGVCFLCCFVFHPFVHSGDEFLLLLFQVRICLNVSAIHQHQRERHHKAYGPCQSCLYYFPSQLGILQQPTGGRGGCSSGLADGTSAGAVLPVPSQLSPQPRLKYAALHLFFGLMLATSLLSGLTFEIQNL
mmetsp:Transcript_39801/g.78262  ORF Transcript_39801/g.78262 Transcript_39801/m.78262 type:complete len:207 (-) Transcript_39801:138-758(-)